MNRLFMLVGAFALFAAMSTAVLAADEKFSIKAFMKKSHAKTGSYRADVQAGIKGKDWDAATKAAKAWFADAQKLTKISPKKGEKENFEKLATTYCKTVKTLLDACEAKDGKKAGGALGKIGSSCGGCHKAHK